MALLGPDGIGRGTVEEYEPYTGKPARTRDAQAVRDSEEQGGSFPVTDRQLRESAARINAEIEKRDRAKHRRPEDMQRQLSQLDTRLDEESFLADIRRGWEPTPESEGQEVKK